jgi:osmotically-inducible protein OsmY
MGVQGRVYGRLQWDKALQGAKLDIEVKNANTVVLTGSVPTTEAKAKAQELAEGTVGVSSVVNQLTVGQQQP